MGVIRLFKFGLLICWCISCPAQKVSTFVQSYSDIDESLFQSSNGILYGTGYLSGSLYIFNTEGVTPVLNSLDHPSEMAELSSGAIAIAESQGNRISLYDPSTSSHQILTNDILNPAGLINLLDSDTLLVSSTSTNDIYKVFPNGDTSLYLSNYILDTPVSFVWDDFNNLYIANYASGVIAKKTSENIVTEFCILPTTSLGHIIKIGNYIYATGVFDHRIYQVNIATGVWDLFAGSTKGMIDGDISAAKFDTPNGIVASQTGDSLYISEYNTQSVRLISGISMATGIDLLNERVSSSSITVWPSPIRRTFSIELQGYNGSIFPELYTAMGTKMEVEVDIQQSSQNTYHGSIIGSLTTGVYFLKVIHETGIESKKIIIKND